VAVSKKSARDCQAALAATALARGRNHKERRVTEAPTRTGESSPPSLFADGALTQSVVLNSFH
jgi:hypothetical protein